MSNTPREAAIKLAREAGFCLPSDGDDFDYPLEIERLIQIAKADEREACARICDRFQARNVGMQPAECAGAIRARSNT